MLIKAIKNAARKYKDKQDQKYYDEMKKTVETASDAELKKLNMDFHHGIAMDLKMGAKIPKIIYRVDDLIENEMHKRNLQSCDDLEEDIWFIQTEIFHLNQNNT